ncbi:hypothetical protein M422DRAFT_174339 [Sphaerobolus stellatus SS14]|uniref:Uncharacterized protein n=1 Tax=Sphaerobolus stellatus (strain SS14) TaxID=990650 RepID=A0A0C9VF88_SPHS4|nr:hypothetical protein M422DRAFT_174339 [Sphaerobolus stellatus SS14]
MWAERQAAWCGCCILESCISLVFPDDIALILNLTGLDNLKLTICKCKPASKQLMHRGLLRFVPMQPSMSLSIYIFYRNVVTSVSRPTRSVVRCMCIDQPTGFTFIRDRSVYVSLRGNL